MIPKRGSLNWIFKSILVMSLFLVNLANAQIYTWVDENGITQFSDTPPQTETFTEVDIQINSYESPTIISNKSTASSSNQVIMYGASWCPYCKKAKKHFANKGIRYKEYDIEKSAKGKREYNKLSGRGVPVILVGDQRLNGFSVESFEKIYF